MKERDYKAGLIGWEARQDLVAPDNIAKWHKGTQYHQFPDKRQLRNDGGAAIALGWLPPEPLITPQTRVLAVGSCFARNFTLWLAEHGFNRAYPESAYNALLQFNADFESPAVVAQQFRWAFDELDGATLLWIDKNRHVVDASEEGKRQVRATLEGTDVLILTLGLSEVWYDKISGEPLWRALTEDTFDPQRHVFRVETVGQTRLWLEAIDRVRKAHLPRLKIVFTVSPIPLKTTFRAVSAVTANSVSKAILRAALDEFLREHADLNRSLFYFPAYEFVTNYFVDPFREDNRHLAPVVPGTIISFFVRHFCDASMVGERDAGSLDAIPGGRMLERVMRHSAIVGETDRVHELLVRIAELEEDLAQLQAACDARQGVIDGLKQAADERLALVETLHRVAQERLEVIQALERRSGAVRQEGS